MSSLKFLESEILAHIFRFTTVLSVAATTSTGMLPWWAMKAPIPQATLYGSAQSNFANDKRLFSFLIVAPTLLANFLARFKIIKSSSEKFGFTFCSKVCNEKGAVSTLANFEITTPLLGSTNQSPSSFSFIQADLLPRNNFILAQTSIDKGINLCFEYSGGEKYR